MDRLKDEWMDGWEEERREEGRKMDDAWILGNARMEDRLKKLNGCWINGWMERWVHGWKKDM